MEDDVSTSSSFALRRIWRTGATRRVAAGAAMAATGGAFLAATRHLPALHIARTSASCAVIACPFLALREVVAGGLAVDGPVASAIAGGVAGYVGALAFSSGPVTWKAVSHGAMVVGVGAGLVDIVVSTMDLRWKTYVLMRRDKNHQDHLNHPHHQLGVGGGGGGQQHEHQIEVIQHGHGDDFNVSVNVMPPGAVSLRDRDEYEQLLQSQKATAAALQHEQDRIARLLATIERLKKADDEGNNVTECSSSSSSTSVVIASGTGSNIRSV